MLISISKNNTTYQVDTSKGMDISTPISAEKSVLAYHIPPPTFSPFRMGSFVGAVNEGGACNCEDITFNAHGNGTHTECVGHITHERITLNSCLKEFHFIALLVSVKPTRMENGDQCMLLADLHEALQEKELTEALIIRTLPNDSAKLYSNYSGQNPTYLSVELATYLAEKKVKHVLLDLPSVDREEDGGALAAHKAFWDFPHNTRMDATITELAYVPEKIKDDYYLLNLQIASFESDASPSKPVLYDLKPTN